MAGNMKQWVLEDRNFSKVLLQDEAAIPTPGDTEILVKFSAASLNPRDVMLLQGTYLCKPRSGVVPVSDGAGRVEAIGWDVKRFRKDDVVVTICNPDHVAGLLNDEVCRNGPGVTTDGVLRQYGVFKEDELIKMPDNFVTLLEGATVPCAALTAWNALYGLTDRRLMAGDWVLTQGASSVSLFALQFAKAAGANVVATASSENEGDKLRKLGADEIINYNEEPDWGHRADGFGEPRGIRHVIDVGAGPRSFEGRAQSLAAVGTEGVISIIDDTREILIETDLSWGMYELLLKACVIRGVRGGSRLQFEEMTRVIEAHDIRPVIDDRVLASMRLGKLMITCGSGNHSVTSA